MEDVGAALGALAFFAFIAFLVWHSHERKLDRRRLRLEEQNRILDRLGSGPELAEFLKSEQGQKILSSLNEPEPERPRNGPYSPYKMGIVGLLTAGVITMGVSVGFFIVANLTVGEFVIPAGICGGIGLGCLLAAWVQYAIGKRWGMLGNSTENGRSARRLG